MATEPGSCALTVGRSFFTAVATSTALEPDWRKTATTTVADGTVWPRTQNRMSLRSFCTESRASATSLR